MGKGVGTSIIQLVSLASRSANENITEKITAQCACHENLTYFVSLYEKRSIWKAFTSNEIMTKDNMLYYEIEYSLLYQYQLWGFDNYNDHYVMCRSGYHLI